MYYLLIIVLLPAYYLAKGAIPQNRVFKLVLAILTLILCKSMAYVAWQIGGSFQYIIWAYLIFSIGNYLLNLFGRRSFGMIFFSGLIISVPDFRMSYFIFRPFWMLIVNLVLIVKRIPMLKLSDRIEIEVESKKENVEIYICV